MAYGYPGMMGGFRGGDFAEPPSFIPQMQSLSDVVEGIANKRMAIAKQEEAQRHAMEKDLYYRGKLEAGEKKQKASERFQQAKMIQDAAKRATLAAGKGLPPGTDVYPDDEGSPYTLEWRWFGGKKKQVLVPAERGAPQEPAAEPPVVPQLEMPEMAPKQAPQGLAPQLRKPKFAGGPIPPTVIQGAFHRLQPQQPDQMFLDEVSGEDARGIPETAGEPGRTVDLPMQAFPEGAREGQRFNAADVNLKGGYGNPFAEPVPPQGLPQVERQPMPEQPMQLGGEAQVTAVPPTSVQGARYEQPQLDQGSTEGDEEGYWEATLHNGKKLTIRPADARAAARAEKEDLASQLMARVNDPMTDPAEKERITRVLPYLVVSGMDPKMGAQLIGQSGAENLEGMKQGGREKLEGIKAENATTLEGVKQKGRMDLAMLKKKRGASGGPLVAGRAGSNGSAFQRLFAKDPMKAERVANGVDAQIARTMKNVNFDKLQGQGVNRLALGLKMLDEGGGTGEFEAMMNFFGYIRGGVPAKNETDEWHRMTRNGISVLDSIGRQLGLGMIGTIAQSRDLSEEEKRVLREKSTGLEPQRKKELRDAMLAARKELITFTQGTADMLAKQFEQYRAPAEKELVQGKIDGLLHYAGLPAKDYFGLGKGSAKPGSRLDSNVDKLTKILGGEE